MLETEIILAGKQRGITPFWHGVINKHESRVFHATELKFKLKNLGQAPFSVTRNFLSKVRNAILDSQQAQKAMNFGQNIISWCFVQTVLSQLPVVS